MLKLVNLGEPESSLILRKPLSPEVQGVTDPASPTGLTHVGGPALGEHRTPRLQGDPRLDSRSLRGHQVALEVSADAPRVKRNGRE